MKVSVSLAAPRADDVKVEIDKLTEGKDVRDIKIAGTQHYVIILVIYEED